MHLSPPSDEARQTLQAELPGSRNAMDQLLRRTAQVLGVLTQELGVAVAPAFNHIVLERLELVQVSSERILMVLTLRSGAVRTVFVEVRGNIAKPALDRVTQVLNERLAGLTVEEIRTSLAERLRDAATEPEGHELLNIFLAEREEIFDLSGDGRDVVLGGAELLADQPEFASNSKMRDLLHLTERRDLLRTALQTRGRGPDHHHRGREPRPAAERLHAGHLLLPRRRPPRRHRGPRADPDALRQDHRAGRAHQPAGRRIADVSDFYSLLGVERDATEADIKKAYRKLAMELHPDRNSSHDAESRFKEVTEAYEVLRDPQKRAAYDRYGKAGVGRAAARGFEYHHVDLTEALNIFMRDFGGLGGLRVALRRRRQRRPARRRGAGRTCGSPSG